MDKAISDYISGASRFVADVTRDAVHRREDLAAQEERDSGLQILVAALLEAKVKDELVISLIQKYYGLNEIEAEERLIAEKTINSPWVSDGSLNEYGIINGNKLEFSGNGSVDVNVANVESSYVQGICAYGTLTLNDDPTVTVHGRIELPEDADTSE